MIMNPHTPRASRLGRGSLLVGRGRLIGRGRAGEHYGRVSTLDAHCMLLRLQAEFSGPESVLLGHGPLGTLEAVQD